MQSVTRPILARDTEALQQALAGLAEAGKTTALVPTMGALHAGHVSLVKRALELADAVVVSIFVNPKQFGPNEDYNRYPRTLERDMVMLGEAGASIIYAPAVEDLYPEGFSTTVSVGALGTVLCGRFRPGHFDGVATVVAKLLLRTLPHVAVFGEKDYQQLCVVRRMVEDLDMAVDIVGMETMREADGLALSSRNAYLTPDDRKLASLLYAQLQQTARAVQTGPVQAALEQGVAALVGKGFKVDYLELLDGATLQAVTNGPVVEARLLVAAWLGGTRLIDNIAVG